MMWMSRAPEPRTGFATIFLYVWRNDSASPWVAGRVNGILGMPWRSRMSRVRYLSLARLAAVCEFNGLRAKLMYFSWPPTVMTNKPSGVSQLGCRPISSAHRNKSSAVPSFCFESEETYLATLKSTAKAVSILRAVFFGPGHVNHDSAAFEFFAIECVDCFLRSFLVFHLYKAEAFGATSVAVGCDSGADDLAELGEQRLQSFIGGI